MHTSVKLAWLALIACLWVSPVSAEAVIAKTVLVTNQVNVLRSATSHTLKRGDELMKLDTVNTGDQSRAVLRFYDGTVLTLGANSDMHMANFIAKDHEKMAVFDFTKGAFRLITGSITQTDSPNFKVNTPIGSIGIRGTEFWGGNLSDDGSIDVLLINSEHTLEVSNEFGTVILDQAGLGTTIKAGQAPTAAKKWGQAKVQRAIEATATE